MATRVTFDLTFDILKRELDDIVTLSEDELAEGVRLALRATHNLAEGAGAAPLAAAMKLRDRLAGKKVVCVMSGGNIDAATLALSHVRRRARSPPRSLGPCRTAPVAVRRPTPPNRTVAVYARSTTPPRTDWSPILPRAFAVDATWKRTRR